ncbi:MAG: hypothetical protein AB1597_02840 [Chloroflexota bacterium]
MKNKSLIAGILSIIAGASSILPIGGSILMMVVLYSSMRAAPPVTRGGPFPEVLIIFFLAFYGLIALGFALLGALGITGGFFALKKRLWPLGLAGAIGGTLTAFPIGIAATVFMAMAHPEFRRVATSPGLVSDQPCVEVPQPGGVATDKSLRIAGILTAVSGGLGVLGALIMVIWLYAIELMRAYPEFYPFFNQPASLMSLMYCVEGAVMLVLGAMAITGGIFILRKRRWGLSLAGAITASIVSPLTGVAGLIFLIMGREGFRSTVPPVVPSIQPT